jgi:histidinol-phosphate/aromatic aminotransferase/cobyric acid decarboxylase-like protein
MTNVISLLDAAEALHMLRHGPPDWNVPGPAELAAMTAAQPNETAIEALRFMRDRTQSKAEYDRAVEALRQMGVSDE